MELGMIGLGGWVVIWLCVWHRRGDFRLEDSIKLIPHLAPFQSGKRSGQRFSFRIRLLKCFLYFLSHCPIKNRKEISRTSLF
jgi:hypothetical protein